MKPRFPSAARSSFPLASALAAMLESFAARAALAVFATGIALPSANAATFLWDGDASSANGQSNVSASQSLNWLNGGNWDNGSTSAPLASWTEGDSAILGGSIAETITLTEGITVGANLRIGSGTNGLGTDPLVYTITGSTLTFQLSNITTASGTTATIASAVGAGTGFNKLGTGTLILQNTAPAPFTSGIALNAGRLEFKATGSRETFHPLTGSGTLVLSAMSGGTNQVRFRSTAAGGGNGDNTFSGPIIMEGGNAQTLRFDSLAAGGDITMNATSGTGGNILEFYHSGALGRKIVFTNVANPLNANPTGTGWMTIKWGNADGLAVDQFENQATIARTFRWYGSSGSVGKVTFNAAITDGVGANTPLNITTSYNIDATLTGNNTFTGPINVSNSGATGLGNTIKISGNGTLGYVSAGVGNYSGNITVAGPTGFFVVNSTATQTLGGVIGNAFLGNSSPGTLAKGNSGTLILTGNNFYTGPTYLTEGTLLVNGDQTNATGTVEVDSGATLGGTGTIGGNVAIYDGGKLTFAISTNSASHDKLDLTDAVAANPGIIPFDVTAKALTFGDTDCTLTLTSSGGASTGTYTLITAPGGIGTVTGGIGTLPTTFTLNYPGTWTSVSAPYIDGNDLKIDIVVPGGSSPTYATWSSGADADADANGDGVFNAVAWALDAADVDENAIGKLPTLDNTSDPDYVIFTFNRSDDANADPKTAISVQYSDDLSDWPTAVHDGTDVIITETPGSPTDQVVVKLKRSTLAPGGGLFVRLKVAITP
jgi:fibronectin-binding autotransporter adhesin